MKEDALLSTIRMGIENLNLTPQEYITFLNKQNKLFAKVIHSIDPANIQPFDIINMNTISHIITALIYCMFESNNTEVNI